MRSIEKEGVIIPALARPNPYGRGYEVIAGHRRMAAGKWAGLTELPVVIRHLLINEASRISVLIFFFPRCCSIVVGARITQLTL